MKKFYLIGSNISTSLSPAIHNYLFSKKGLSATHSYSVHPKQGYLPSRSQLEREDMGGLSITIPLKKAYKHLQSQSNQSVIDEYQGQYAADTGVINTVSKGTGKIIAYNTDIWAISRLLSPLIQGVKQPIRVLILGAGATSHTFCYYFSRIEQCDQIHMYNRSPNKVQQLSLAFPELHVRDCSQKTDISVLVNTLPTQALQQSSQSILHFMESKRLIANSELLAMDVNYRDSEQTFRSLLSNISTRSTQISGIHMLILQAIQQNRLFAPHLQNPQNDVHLLSEIKQYLQK